MGLTIAAAAIGVVAAFRMPAAILPEITFPRLKVIADSGERPGAEVLRSITRPLEEALQRVPSLVEMRSVTSRGSVEINLDCAWGTDMDKALQLVQARIDGVRERLPAGTTIDVQVMNPALFPVLGFSLVSDHRSSAELRDLAIMRMQPELSRLPGVAQVVVQGGDRLEARVSLDPAALESRGLGAADVARAVSRAAELRSVGLLDANGRLYLGLADARPAGLDALSDLAVPVDSGAPVLLRTLGNVTLSAQPQFTRYAAQSHSAVLVNLLRRPTASTIQLANGVDQWLREHRQAIPSDIRLQTFYDQSDLVRASVGSVRDSLLVGALMAMVVVLVFLRSMRAGIVTAIVLPGTIALTILGLALCHQSLNMMTLGGIAAAVGLVLDDAIVVVEHLDHVLTPEFTLPMLFRAMGAIAPTLLGSSLCSLAIFIPFAFLGGVSGAFFRALALAMGFMLTASFVLCLTVVPFLVSRWTPKLKRPSSAHGRFENLVRYATRHAWVAIVPALVLVIAVVPLSRLVGSGFLPEMDEGSLIMDYVTPPGTSLTETDRMLRQMEGEIDRIPEIAAWSRRTGDQLGFFITEPNRGDYVLRLKTRRTRSADQVADALRERIATTQPALEVEFGQLVEDVIGDLTTAPQPIELRIFGEDRGITQQRAAQAAALISHVRGVVDIKSGIVVSGPNISIVPGPGAQRAGLSAEDLANAVEPYLAGVDAGVIQRGARAWPVRVTLPLPAGITGPDGLAEARIPVTRRHWVRLGQVASVRIEPGETEIDRDNQRTMVDVTARLSGRDLGSAVAEIQALLRRQLPLGPGMSIQYGGQWAEQQSSFRGLGGVLLGAAMAVLLVLVVSFRSWRRSLAVLLVAVSSLPGVFVALVLGGATFNVASFVGAIMMVGIVAENAYFLVAEHDAGLALGMTPADAAIVAARRRARPILMTTGAGVSALAPLALGLGTGSALLKPLAIAVVGGFTTSAILLLLVLPALLARCGSSSVATAGLNT